FVFGLGPSHKLVIENMLGLCYDHPALHVEEYLRVVTDLARDGKTSFQGRLYRVNAPLHVACGSPPPVLVGALGPRMRRVAGALAPSAPWWATPPRSSARSAPSPTPAPAISTPSPSRTATTPGRRCGARTSCSASSRAARGSARAWTSGGDSRPARSTRARR